MSKFIRETSAEVARKIIAKALIQPCQTILEPSAGTGGIVDIIKQDYPLHDLDIVCVELNKEKCEILNDKGYATRNGDFLNFVPLMDYDRIIACPPFKANIDLEHIMRMYLYLKKGGLLVSLTSPLWILNNEQHQVKFREWLADKKHDMELLPDNSFMEGGKTVPSMILRIFK